MNISNKIRGINNLKTLKRIFAIFCVSVSITIATPTCFNYSVLTVEAHSGRTDSRGGHRDNKNKSGLGSYHYHCGGYPAHLHENGVCPYSNSSKVSSSSSSSSSVISSNTTQSKYTYSYSAKYKSASTEFASRLANGQFSQTIINQMPSYQSITASLLSQNELSDYTYLRNGQDIDDMSKLIFIRMYDYVLSQQVTQQVSQQTLVSTAFDNSIFSAQYYISAYPDLATAIGYDAQALYNHFMQNGIAEGRQGCATFNVNLYIANNPDLQQVFGGDLMAYCQHYLNYGQYEGRIAN